MSSRQPARAADGGATPGAEARAIVANKRGLHARAAARLVQLAEGYRAEVRVACRGVSVRGTSVMGLLSLAAGLGSELVITAEGPEAAVAVAAFVALVQSKFDED